MCVFSLILVQFLHLVSGILHCTVYKTDQDDPVQKLEFVIFILGRARIWFKADGCVTYGMGCGVETAVTDNEWHIVGIRYI